MIQPLVKLLTSKFSAMLEQIFSSVYIGNKFVDNKKIPGY